MHAEMEAVKTQVGFKGTLQEFFKYLRTDPRFYYTNAASSCSTPTARRRRGWTPRLPKLFSLLPKADFEIRPVEEFRAKSSAAGAVPAGVAGRLAPGHLLREHLRPEGAAELSHRGDLPARGGARAITSRSPSSRSCTALPRFRRFGGYTAYDEGWGLYAETLGKELGMYQDPYQYYGKLAAEMLRCIRLVTDTGMHHKGWTREQALKYMLDNSSMPETDATAEIERYIAIPSQALAYKVGQLQDPELRAKAEQALGDKFDVREFHARVLEDGALPLDVLEAKIDRWIAH